MTSADPAAAVAPAPAGLAVAEGSAVVAPASAGIPAWPGSAKEAPPEPAGAAWVPAVELGWDEVPADVPELGAVVEPSVELPDGVVLLPEVGLDRKPPLSVAEAGVTSKVAGARPSVPTARIV